MDTKMIGKRIQEARLARKLTQADLSQMVNLVPKYLSNIECGVKNPSLETLVDIANALQVDANTLLVDVLEVAPEITASQFSEKFSSLPENQQQKLMRMIELFLEDPSN